MGAEGARKLRSAAEGNAALNDPEHRRNPRSNLMLAATVEAGHFVTQARIRNLSECGALLEGAGLPPEGARFCLSRNGLQVAATVAWSRGDRRGVRFDEPTPLAAWTGGTLTPVDQSTSRPGLVAVPNPNPSAGAAAAGTSPADRRPHGKSEDLDIRLAEEIAYVQRLVEQLGETLAGDRLVVHRHPDTLQTVDLASQILAHLATVVRSDDRPAAVDRIGLQDLRARLKRKPLVPCFPAAPR